VLEEIVRIIRVHVHVLILHVDNVRLGIVKDCVSIVVVLHIVHVLVPKLDAKAHQQAHSMNALCDAVLPWVIDSVSILIVIP